MFRSFNSANASQLPRINSYFKTYLVGFQAEKKGCTATEYGLVFGVFELIVFIVSPFYGAHLNKLGMKLLFNGGILTTGTCAILFG